MPRLRKGSRQLTPERTNRARNMRKGMGASEQVFWRLIRQSKTGFKFRRQHIVGPYTLDFYCAEAKVCVEVDGEQHELRRDRDQARDKYLKDLGVLTVRVPSLDLFEETYTESTRWVTKIIELCEARSGRRAYEDR